MTDVLRKQGDPWSEVTVRETGERYHWNERTGALVLKNLEQLHLSCSNILPRPSSIEAVITLG